MIGQRSLFLLGLFFSTSSYPTINRPDVPDPILIFDIRCITTENNLFEIEIITSIPEDYVLIFEGST